MARHAWISARLLATMLLLGACAANAPSPAQPTTEYTNLAELEVYLQQEEERQCAFVVGIRNRSDIRKGPSYLTLVWLGTGNTRLAASEIRMDPVRIDLYDAKNSVIPAIGCASIHSVYVESAEWSDWNWEDGQLIDNHRHRIDNVEGLRLTFSWNAELPAYVARNY